MLDPKSQNPFPHRPPTATGGQRLVGKVSEDEMSELDHPSHMPEGVDPSQWDRLVGARHRKWDSETKVDIHRGRGNTDHKCFGCC